MATIELSPQTAKVERRRPRVSWRWIAMALAVAWFLAIAGIALNARAALVEGRFAANTGRTQLAAGQMAPAATSFRVATDQFGAADRYLRNPLLAPLNLLPVARQNLRGLQTLTMAGGQLSRAGVAISAAASEIGTDASALAPRGGAIPLEPLEALAGPMGDAAAATRSANTLAEQADSALLLPPIRAAANELLAVSGQAQEMATAAEAVTKHLPAFLGSDGPRRYLFGAANPAELRGSAGLIGAYTLLEASDGALEFGSFVPIHDLQAAPVGEMPAADPSLETRYDRYGGTGFWLNINMTPDFPSAATAIERLWEHGGGSPLDGTVVATPAALARLLEVTGPTEVPRLGTVDAAHIEEAFANEAYGKFATEPERKRVLGSVASGVFKRFLSGAGDDPVAAGRALIGAAAAGDLLIHSAHPDEQAAFESLGMAGPLGGVEGDFLAVVGNNAAGNKADFYSDRSVRYEATLLEGGFALGTVTVTVTNNTPTKGLPPYVIGPFSDEFEPGENRTLLSVYCARGCLLHRALRDGEASDVQSQLELGHPVFDTVLRLPSGESAEVTYRWTAPNAWEAKGSGMVYRLTFRDQATIRPTEMELEVEIPEGLHVVRTSHAMVDHGDRVTWQGEPSATQTFEIEFDRPLIGQLVDSVGRWWDGPVGGR